MTCQMDHVPKHQKCFPTKQQCKTGPPWTTPLRGCISWRLSSHHPCPTPPPTVDLHGFMTNGQPKCIIKAILTTIVKDAPCWQSPIRVAVLLWKVNHPVHLCDCTQSPFNFEHQFRIPGLHNPVTVKPMTGLFCSIRHWV